MEKVRKLNKPAHIHRSLFLTDAMGLTASSMVTATSLAMMDCDIASPSEITLFLLELLLSHHFITAKGKRRRLQENDSEFRSQIQEEAGGPAKGSGCHIRKFQCKEKMTCRSLQQVSFLPLQPVSSLVEDMPHTHRRLRPLMS